MGGFSHLRLGGHLLPGAEAAGVVLPLVSGRLSARPARDLIAKYSKA